MVDIRFGTEGWRGIIGDDFTFANVRRIGEAIARYLKKAPLDGESRPIIIGYDTRLLSDQYAQELAGVLETNGIPSYVSNKPVITPALSLATARLKARLGIMVTASHNPPQYNGIKLKASYGGPVGQEVIAGIEASLPDELPPVIAQSHNTVCMNLDSIYLAAVGKQINRQAIFQSGLTVVVDAMHGAGVGYLDTLLEECGIKVIRIRDKIDPDFGGTNPEPIAQNLEPLRVAVEQYQADLGLATDGDGDRIGVVDHTGQYVDAQQVFLLLLTHLVMNKGKSGIVARTVSTSSLVDTVAAHFGLVVRETPIGFKYITALCRAESVLLGGEESGGFGFPWHLLDRDGVMAGLILVEYISQMETPLRVLLDDLLEQFGPSVYRRLDFPLPPDFSISLLEPPLRLGQRVVTQIKTLDGLKLWLGEDGWVLIRASGTEPMLRVYAEARSKSLLEEIIQEGTQWVQKTFPLRQNRSCLP